MKALECIDLKKIYGNGYEALKGITLNVNEGDFFALLGANGAGKSTTLGIINSLVKKASGIVRVFGHDIDSDPQAAKRCLGVVPQEFNLNIFEKAYQILINQAGYYGVPRHIALARVETYLSAVGLLEQRNLAVRELSGGMKRRLMIARALMHEPALLLLDEPTAGVDIEIRRLIWDFLVKLKQSGITIILTTHYLEEAENLCNEIAIIDHGNVIKHTSMKNLLQELNVETFILNTESTLSPALSLDNFNARVLDQNTLELDIQRGRTLNEAFSALTQQNIRVTSLRNKSNRLEELFLGLINAEGKHHG